MLMCIAALLLVRILNYYSLGIYQSLNLSVYKLIPEVINNCTEE